ncbi:MAG: hypothetical protein IM574_10820 [Cytophagales bacterium]|nr:hypothetical protein [Cytophagales bacterium]MCA6387526.1 hypothetical protein [Cytophagales bacterium]MCA6391197.1 hypothetical protein [Cytophagales bacterium]MCA6395835.1 hypothetical protein [Cytophagales bacterium]MCA6397658.1 hypothetical protein [Cytophagales bacterium]
MTASNIPTVVCDHVRSPIEISKLEFATGATATGATGFDWTSVLGAVPAIANTFAGLFAGKPEDTSDVGYQAALQARDQQRAAIAQEQSRQAAIQAEAKEKNTITYVLVGVMVFLILVGGSVLIFIKK